MLLHFTILVINNLGGYTHTNFPYKSNFKKLGTCMFAFGWCTPGLANYVFYSDYILIHYSYLPQDGHVPVLGISIILFWVFTIKA